MSKLDFRAGKLGPASSMRGDIIDSWSGACRL